MLSLHSSFNALGPMPAGRFDWCPMISVKSNINEVLGWTARLSKQYEFAVASSLTAVVKQAQAAMPDAVEQDLDRPTRFTKQAFGISAARKDKLTASVFVKRLQAEYLAFQVYGGTRTPAKKALRLPAEVQLDAFGNMPKGLIKQLISRARINKRVTKTQSKRFGVSQGLDLFYGDPGNGRPPGIYKRIERGQRDQLVPIIVFPKQPAKYKRRFNFHAAARRVVVANYERTLLQAWARAKATAR